MNLGSLSLFLHPYILTDMTAMNATIDGENTIPVAHVRNWQPAMKFSWIYFHGCYINCEN